MLAKRPPILTKSRAGITLIGCLLLVGWFFFLILCLSRWRWVGGATCVGVTVAFFTAVHLWYRYTSESAFELDSVRCGFCTEHLKFDCDGLSNGGRWQCKCGAQYLLEGPTLYLLNSSGDRRRYMKWKWWGKGTWRPQLPA